MLVQALTLNAQMKTVMLELTTVGETRVTRSSLQKTFGDQFKMESNWELKLVCKSNRVNYLYGLVSFKKRP